MNILPFIFRVLERMRPAEEAYAHCDIPCGIYDPHIAQLSAHTVIRMTILINEAVSKLPSNITDMLPEQRRDFIHKISRYTAVKEEHAEAVKKETRILWGDYFKPEHTEKFPELHQLVWDIMKLGSKARQEVDLKASEQLLEKVNRLAEIFWETKNVGTVKAKAPYPTEREMVFPKM